MGFLDSLIGRTRMPKPNEDHVFAMSTAVLTLEAAGGLKAAGRVGIVFKALPSGRFLQLVQDTSAMLQVPDQAVPGDTLKVTQDRDELGFEWMVVQGPDFQALVAALHGVAENLLEDGLGDCLLAAVFPFHAEGRTVYWIYGYKQGTFYPFVPSGDHRRDNAEELRLAAVAKGELPVEADLGSWFALWGVPV